MPECRTQFSPDGAHVFPVRVYYEDTDAGGIVYHSNYLKFAERGRTEVLRDLGIEHRALMESDGVAFAVRRCEIDYLAPARLDDELAVHTVLRSLGNASIDLVQTIYRGADQRELARLVIRLAIIRRDGRPTRLPAKVADALRPLMNKGDGEASSARHSGELHTTASKKRA